MSDLSLEERILEFLMTPAIISDVRREMRITYPWMWELLDRLREEGKIIKYRCNGSRFHFYCSMFVRAVRTNNRKL